MTEDTFGPESPFSASEQRRYRVISRFAEKRQERQRHEMSRGAPESLRVFYGLNDEYPLEQIPEHIFSGAAEHIVSNRDWHELMSRAVEELEELDQRYVQERRTHDTFELAERHGQARVLLAAAKAADEKTVNPEVIDMIQDDERYREALSELYLAKRSSMQVDELSEELEIPLGDLQEAVQTLHGAEFVRATGNRVCITPRGEAALERALSLA